MAPVRCLISLGVIGNCLNRLASRICLHVGPPSLVHWALFLLSPLRAVSTGLGQPWGLDIQSSLLHQGLVLLQFVDNSFVVHRFMRPELCEFNHTSSSLLYFILFLLVFFEFDSQTRISLLGKINHATRVDNQRRRVIAIAGFRTCCSKARFVSRLSEIIIYMNNLESQDTPLTSSTREVSISKDRNLSLRMPCMFLRIYLSKDIQASTQISPPYSRQACLVTFSLIWNSFLREILLYFNCGKMGISYSLNGVWK